MAREKLDEKKDEFDPEALAAAKRTVLHLLKTDVEFREAVYAACLVSEMPKDVDPALQFPHVGHLRPDAFRSYQPYMKGIRR